MNKLAALVVLGCLAVTINAQTKTRQCRGEYVRAYFHLNIACKLDPIRRFDNTQSYIIDSRSFVVTLQFAKAKANNFDSFNFFVLCET